MSQGRLTFLLEDWQEPFYDRGSGLSELLLFATAQRDMMDAISELHALTDGVMLHRTAGSTSTAIPTLMIHTMESRERAKRLYRSALRTKVSGDPWNLEGLLEELENELLRSSGALRLYQRRGSYY